jgi:hypothetical protein
LFEAKRSKGVPGSEKKTKWLGGGDLGDKVAGKFSGGRRKKTGERREESSTDDNSR